MQTNVSSRLSHFTSNLISHLTYIVCTAISNSRREDASWLRRTRIPRATLPVLRSPSRSSRRASSCRMQRPSLTTPQVRSEARGRWVRVTPTHGVATVSEFKNRKRGKIWIYNCKAHADGFWKLCNQMGFAVSRIDIFFLFSSNADRWTAGNTGSSGWSSLWGRAEGAIFLIANSQPIKIEIWHDN